MSIDHFTGSSAAASNITTIRYVMPSIAPSATPSTEPFGSPSDLPSSSHCPALSPSALDLCVDLSSYSLVQQPSSSVRSAAPEVSRQHHMVLRPC